MRWLLAGGLGIGTLIGLGKIALQMIYYKTSEPRDKRPWEREQPPV
ncbi:MAG TPA: hypothetical protein VKE98_04600 [Gemmataceae bacterium]|nr:hypothetical protein [Gemmataceae bacterium]